MTLDRSYKGYLGFLGIDLFKSVIMYSNGAICLIKLLFKMGLFTVNKVQKHIVFRLLFNCTGKTMKNRETITSIF